MRKITVVVALAGALFSAQSFAATSGAAVSGSAGFGIDLAGLAVAINAAPFATVTLGEGTLGGPCTGLAKWALKRK